jgi:glycine cleavage system H protein
MITIRIGYKMENIFFTEDHYWVSVENDVITVGLTDFILNSMNVINYIELPSIGALCSKTEVIGEISHDDDEHFELCSIFNGEIIDTNYLLTDNYEQLFSREKNNNWLYRLYITSQEEKLEDILMSEEEYQQMYLEEL